MDSDSAADLISLCYDPNLAKHCGEKLSLLFTQHLSALQGNRKRFQEWRSPDENVAHAIEQLHTRTVQEVQLDLASGTSKNESIVQQFDALVKLSLDRSQGLHHPHCAGHQVPAVMPLAGWFDAMTALSNQVQGVYEMGPWSVAVERAVLQEIGKEIGFREKTFGSLITSGGSLANLTALLAARHRRCPEFWKHGTASRPTSKQAADPVLVIQQDAHYCVDRAAGVMGVGTKNLVRVPLDEHRRMDVRQLQTVLRDLSDRSVPVIAVVSVAGSTACGAFDPIEEIAEVCRDFGVWLHVDAAHGGSLCLSQKHRDLVSGLHLADSVVVDAHKMMFVPAVCAMVFFKDKADQFAAFDQSAPYLFDPSAPDFANYDNAVVTLECTKRASAMGIWGVWSLFGKNIFSALAEHVLQLAIDLNELLNQHPMFETWGEPSCNIILFRHLDERVKQMSIENQNQHQLRLRRRLLESGMSYLTQTKIDQKIYLRSTMMNPKTTETDLREMLQAISEAGSRLSLTSEA